MSTLLDNTGETGDFMKERSITITAGNLTMNAIMNDSDTANEIWNSLPISGSANVWGDEIYFAISVKTEEDPNASDLVSSGDLAYWPPGDAFCIFFGRTPASTDDQPRAASPVNVFGHIDGDEKLFLNVESSKTILRNITMLPNCMISKRERRSLVALTV